MDDLINLGSWPHDRGPQPQQLTNLTFLYSASLLP